MIASRINTKVDLFPLLILFQYPYLPAIDNIETVSLITLIKDKLACT